MLKKNLHCPVCNSHEIYRVVGGYTGNLYKCKRCGYQGALVIEHDDDLNCKFEEAASYNIKDDNQEDSSSTLKIIMKIILIALFIMSLLAIYAGKW